MDLYLQQTELADDVHSFFSVVLRGGRKINIAIREDIEENK
jgi:hypothetical protein